MRSPPRLVALLLLVLGACSSKIPVHVDQSSLADFSPYRTYAWLAAPPEPQPGETETPVELFGWRMRSAVESGMRARGYALDGEAPDLLVTVRVTLEDRYTDSFSEYWRYSKIGGSQNLFSAFSLGYEEATLVVEAFDARTRQLVWRGHTAVSMDAEQRGDRAAASVTALMQTFPQGARL